MYKKRKSTSRYYKDKKGYLVDKKTGKPKHRSIMERIFGHSLSKGSVVHHKNRKKTDNRPSNLWVFGSQKQHHKAHKKDKKKWGIW